MSITNLLIVAGTSVARNVLGVLENASSPESDLGTVISTYEKKQLLETFIRVTVLQVALYFSMNGVASLAGHEEQLSMWAVAGSGFLLDKILSAIKKR